MVRRSVGHGNSGGEGRKYNVIGTRRYGDQQRTPVRSCRLRSRIQYSVVADSESEGFAGTRQPCRRSWVRVTSKRSHRRHDSQACLRTQPPDLSRGGTGYVYAVSVHRLSSSALRSSKETVSSSLRSAIRARSRRSSMRRSYSAIDSITASRSPAWSITYRRCSNTSMGLQT